jgi:hypothetical protein
MRPHYDPHTLWLLSGIAVRIGQKLGLHRESANQTVTIFEAEMRRRLWWQILILDFRSAQFSGTTVEGEHQYSDTARPSNVNDSDLSPTMTEAPREHAGSTDMLFCSVRYEIGEFMRQSRLFGKHRSGGAVGMASIDKAIDELEDRLEQKYLRYCDPSVPLHLLSSALARSAVCQMRLLAHHPRQYPNNGDDIPKQERNMLFSISLKMVEYDNLGQTTKSIQGFRWHMNVYLQLDAFIYLLSELRNRVDGPEIDKAWDQVEKVYDNHPEMLRDSRSTLYFAIGNLAVKAWEKRLEAVTTKQGFSQPTTPQFIILLRSQRKMQNRNTTKHVSNVSEWPTAEVLPQPKLEPQEMLSNWDTFSMPSDMIMDGSPMDWEYWQTLIDGCEMPMLDINGQQLYSMG